QSRNWDRCAQKLRRGIPAADASGNRGRRRFALASHPAIRAPDARHCAGHQAYPLINYEYAVVTKKQRSPENAAALRSFLLWAIAPDETNAQYLADAHFIPLPAHVWVLSHDQIEEIR